MKQRQEFQYIKIAHQADLLRAIIESQETERKRIGQDLHDDVGTSLSGLRLMIEMFKPTDSTDAAYKNFADTSKATIDKIISDVRNISHNLSPTTLRYYGLIAAITEHSTIINQSGQLKIILVNNADAVLKKLDLPVATALYRVIEELINNTIRHSEANNVKLSFYTKDNALFIDYQDDGKGLPNQNKQIIKGMGLQNIESRLLNINATFTLNAYNGKGFQININYPLV